MLAQESGQFRRQDALRRFQFERPATFAERKDDAQLPQVVVKNFSGQSVTRSLPARVTDEAATNVAAFSTVLRA